ncbi:hypothetical protein D623_10010810 [Myotis brandtii]|uniref:Uncharacterized protein n=1 Tax=Myotis brandtii TaxID=109478 RepID=S7PP79_MYOBR|nr:hypothetical protein D623_10010810 [Myotis brandtii]
MTKTLLDQSVYSEFSHRIEMLYQRAWGLSSGRKVQPHSCGSFSPLCTAAAPHGSPGQQMHPTAHQDNSHTPQLTRIADAPNSSPGQHLHPTAHQDNSCTPQITRTAGSFAAELTVRVSFKGHHDTSSSEDLFTQKDEEQCLDSVVIGTSCKASTPSSAVHRL